MEHPNKSIMKKAIDLAKEKNGVAAVIVKGNEIIATGTTTNYIENIPIKHGEMNAIEQACKKLDSMYLEDCWLYTTYEPCPMCTAACIWAKMKGIVFGASMEDRNSTYTQRILVPCQDILKKGTPQLLLHQQFMREECKKLLLLPLVGK